MSPTLVALYAIYAAQAKTDASAMQYYEVALAALIGIFIFANVCRTLLHLHGGGCGRFSNLESKMELVDIHRVALCCAFESTLSDVSLRAGVQQWREFLQNTG